MGRLFPIPTLDGIAVAASALDASGFTDWPKDVMLAIAGAESGWKHNATNATHDYGTWQINSHYWPQLFTKWQWDDPWQNVKMAHEVYRLQGLHAWVTYYTGAYKKYLPAAQKYYSSGAQPLPQQPAPVGGSTAGNASVTDAGPTMRAGANRFTVHAQRMQALYNVLNTM